MSDKKLSTHEMVHLALTVAALIAGGYSLYLIGVTFPIPGAKYLILTPYLSFMITFVLKYFHNPKSFFYVNTSFGLIMSIMNIYMGLAIFTVGIITQLAMWLVPRQLKMYTTIISFIYAESVIFSAIFASALIIKLPLYDHLSLRHLAILGALGSVTSYIGNQMGLHLVRRLPKKVL